MIKSPDDSDYKVIQEYSTKDKLNFVPAKHGNYIIRVNAKSSESSNDFDRYYEKKVFY